MIELQAVAEDGVIGLVVPDALTVAVDHGEPRRGSLRFVKRVMWSPLA